MPDLSQLKASLIAEISDYVTDFEKAGQVAMQFGKATKDAGDQVGKKKDQMGALIGQVKNFMAPALAATATIAGIGFTAKKAWDTLGEGAELLLTRQRFANLSAEIGITSDALLNRLRPAIRGMMTDQEAVALATQLMSLGLAKNAEEATRLTRVASALKMPLNDLILTLTNQRTMRFDQLNVQVDGFNEKLSKLKETMSDEEAFKMAFLAQAEEQIERIGDAANSTAGDLTVMANSWKTVTENAKMEAATLLGPVIHAVSQSVLARQALDAALENGIIRQAEYEQKLYYTANTAEAWGGVLTWLEDRQRMYDNKVKEAALYQEIYTLRISDTAEATNYWAQMGQEANQRLAKTESLLGSTADQAEATTAILKGLAGATADLDGSFANNTNMAASMLEEWDWAQAGGADLQAKLEEIGALKVEPEVKKQLLEEAMTTAVELDISLGNISEYEGAQLLKDALDLTTLDEAKALLSDGQEGILDDLKRLDQMISTATVEIEDKTEEIREELLEFGQWWEGNHYANFIANYKTGSGDNPYDAAQGTGGGGKNNPTIPDEDLGDISHPGAKMAPTTASTAGTVIYNTQIFNNELAMKMAQAANQKNQLAALEKVM